MRYLIDEKNTSPETSLALYQITLAWAASAGDRFVLGLHDEIYDNPDDFSRLTKLGQPPLAPPLAIPGIVYAEGVPGPPLVEALTCRSAPARATAGDLCPAEIVLIYKGERTLYALYDYGRTQLLDLTPQELDQLRKTTSESGHDPASFIPAPPEVAM
jgi:hypothetical protein